MVALARLACRHVRSDPIHRVQSVQNRMNAVPTNATSGIQPGNSVLTGPGARRLSLDGPRAECSRRPHPGAEAGRAGIHAKLVSRERFRSRRDALRGVRAIRRGSAAGPGANVRERDGSGRRLICALLREKRGVRETESLKGRHGLDRKRLRFRLFRACPATEIHFGLAWPVPLGRLRPGAPAHELAVPSLCRA
jgi:hypothetical protein